MPRFFRYLRIAFSITCFIACVLLISLWVRSYSWAELFLHNTSGPLRYRGVRREG